MSAAGPKPAFGGFGGAAKDSSKPATAAGGLFGKKEDKPAEAASKPEGDKPAASESVKKNLFGGFGAKTEDKPAEKAEDKKEDAKEAPKDTKSLFGAKPDASKSPFGQPSKPDAAKSVFGGGDKKEDQKSVFGAPKKEGAASPFGATKAKEDETKEPSKVGLTGGTTGFSASKYLLNFKFRLNTLSAVLILTFRTRRWC